MRREIKQIMKGEAVTEGAGVKLRRVFGYMDTPTFDPFLMLDDFRGDSPEDFINGFPWHPHRGIETITYVTSGDVEHGDSLGNDGVISSGDVQWMTAGSGIIHQEMPKGDDAGRMHGFQLWANLPARDKMMDPRYRGITADEIPEITLDDGTVIKVIAGTIANTTGPVGDIVIDPEYMDCTVPAGVEFVHPTKQGHTAFIYVIDGKGTVNGTTVENKTLVLFDDGDEFAISGANETVRFLLLTGKPLNEPIAWRGPIVMNTQEELTLAFKEYQDGTFVKHAKP
ncbi:pirin family protein [Pseudodesulfovibrio sp. zrk46]|uniref:pirin family protein n=1 Tax=Pseudodesulfovibrio sp. zrk46 TaxID=2725288 RepID=UPI0014496486|nr:pirin family protein [Pseudodesulfovibrio sp. zrk46]QJB56801.1 pirin family protein [Pseudodesulfovibrio sp. zrk46]